MKTILLVVLSLFLAACAGTQNVPMDRAALATLKGKSLIVVTHESPSFVAMTSGKGMFAVAGVGAVVVAGNKPVKEKNIEDPAPKVGVKLAEGLASGYGLLFSDPSSRFVESKELFEIANQADDSDYALDVSTNGGSYMYDGFHFSDYHAGCFVKMKLIHLRGCFQGVLCLRHQSRRQAGCKPRSAGRERCRLHKADPRGCHDFLCRKIQDRAFLVRLFERYRR